MPDSTGAGDATTVWVVVADYGLNGAGVLGVFAEQPTFEQCDELARTNLPGAAFPHTSVTGWGGYKVERWSVA